MLFLQYVWVASLSKIGSRHVGQDADTCTDRCANFGQRDRCVQGQDTLADPASVEVTWALDRNMTANSGKSQRDALHMVAMLLDRT